jgi:two-component system sensor histidine kinase CiaH
MIKKLRLQFVAICMLLVTAVLAVVFLSAYSSAERNLERTSRLLLERVINAESIPLLPGGDRRQDTGSDLGSGDVQLPYFTVEIWNGSTAYVTGGTYADLENTEELRDILSECLKQTDSEGLIAGYNLRYLRQDNGLFQRVAFVDNSMAQSTLNGLIRAYFQIGLAALLLLLGVSLLLSYWVTRPVEKAWKQQRQFLSDASHELKTPLTVILSNAELMDSAPLPEKPARWADNIHSEAVRMKTLVEEMLTLARADNMVRTAVYTQVDLTEVAADCALMFEAVAFEAGKPLEYDDLQAGLLVSGDADKLRQVISVLLDNAVKYGRPGGVIHMTLHRAERNARLTVSNENADGPIPPEQLVHLFERFYRADASRGEQSGFGLGLPIAAAIAAEHKGSLRAESNAVSTRFLLTVPLEK